MIALSATLLIIAGALYYAIREIQAQTPRNSHRRFGGV
jgi:hypothetical protein